jgi:hypothetical protein
MVFGGIFMSLLNPCRLMLVDYYSHFDYMGFKPILYIKLLGYEWIWLIDDG